MPWGNLRQLDSPCPCSRLWCKELHIPLYLPLASFDSPAQKLVFNRVNGKRPQVLLQQVSAPEECYTLAHEENVRFIYEGEGRRSLRAGTHSLSCPVGLEDVGSLLRQLHCAGDLGGRDEVSSLGSCPLSCSSPGLGNPHPKIIHCLFPPAWQQVEQQLDGSRSGDSACGPVQYVEKTPNPGLKSKWETVVALRGAMSWCGLSWAPEQGCSGRRIIPVLMWQRDALGRSCQC